MKKILFAIVLLATIQAVTAESIIITQVLYDPVQESGSEAVELFNPTTSAIDISGWLVSTEPSASDATIPEGTILLPKQYYLVADAGWNTLRDDLSWPAADHEEALTLANTDAGIAVSNTTHIIDAVGWGNPLNIESGLFEGKPYSEGTQGNSLRRLFNSSYRDTNENSLDFYSAIPFFHNSSLQQGAEIKVSAVVIGGTISIDSISILQDDDILQGIQIAPVPKANKTITIRAQFSAGSGLTVNVTVNSATWPMTEVNASTYEAQVNMPYSAPAGDYTATVAASDEYGTVAESSLQFEYMSLVAMEIDSSSLQFGAMPGQYSEVLGDSNMDTDNTTIWNIGNSKIDLQLWATNLTASASVIDINNLEYSLDEVYNDRLSNKAEIKPAGIDSAEKKPLSFRLNIPTGAKPGNYTGSIFITAVKS